MTVPANGSVSATFNAVCHAVAYNLYRSPAGTGAWTLVASRTGSATDATDNGTDPIVLTLTDAVAAGTAGAPPASNGAALAPYPQNPSFLAALNAEGIGFDASDASKTYPSDPLNLASPPIPAGSAFFEGAVQAVPRYPSNVYYNVALQAQQLDEYNWIYVTPPGGSCVDSSVNTCRATPATWAEYVASENRIMFRHVVDNDPRPHYIHQSNLAGYNPNLPETDPAQGGIAYPVFGGLLTRYEAAFDRASEPLVQLTHTQIGQTLAQQDAWAATRTAGTVTAWLADGSVHVKNTGDTGATGGRAAHRHHRGHALRRSEVGLGQAGPGGRAGFRPQRPGQHRRPRGDRHRARRGDADGGERHLERHSDDQL